MRYLALFLVTLSILTLSNFSYSASPALRSLYCDVDKDCDVDSNDISVIHLAEKTPVSRPDDPGDADRNGRITSRDEQKCVKLCTLPKCANLEPGLIPAQNVVGLSQAVAGSAIVTAGLLVGTVTTANSNSVAAGNVISQSPTAGTNVAAGSAVDLVVSLGAASGVPGALLIGDPLAPAVDAVADTDTKRQFDEAGFVLDSSSGLEVSRSALRITLRPDATVGGVNALLESISARIAISGQGVDMFVIEFPPVGSSADLDLLLSTIASSPQIQDVIPIFKVEPAKLPPSYSMTHPEGGGEFLVDVPVQFAEKRQLFNFDRIDIVGQQLAFKRVKGRVDFPIHEP